MSGIGMVLGPDNSGERVRALVSQMPDRGTVITSALASPGLAVASHAWQERLSGGSIGKCRDVVVVADASIYYRDDLIRRLSAEGIRPESNRSPDLIAAAVAAWDANATLRLEGDFAYIAYSASTHRGHAARDPVGTRPLYFANAGGRLAIASSASAIAKSGLSSKDLNHDWLAELAAGLVNVGSESAYRDVSALRQGERIQFDAAGGVKVESWYSPPPFTEDGSSTQSFDDAAAELRVLITDAVRERLDPDGQTFVSLSGGRDSTAVYAAGRHLAGERLSSVSLSYPSKNSGREDETILEVLGQCGGEPRWIETMQVPLLAPISEETGALHDAFRHPYEGTTRAMAKVAASNGSRVMLNGLGGDTLFHAETSFLADLFARGNWGRFRAELESFGIKPSARNVFRFGVLPRLGRRSRDIISAARGGRRVHDVWDLALAPWVRPPRRVVARAWAEPYRKLRRGGAADRERRFMIEGPFPGRIIPEYCRVSAAVGVEQRSPLYDLRIVNFAARRPRSERRSGREYKRLLRASMVGWLPSSVTGPRHNPTGLTGDYFRKTAAQELPQVIGKSRDRMLLVELGLVFANQYAAEVDRLARTGDHQHIAALVFTTLTELWLQQQV